MTGSVATAACPVCGKPATQATRPFCSARCADVDLQHWFTERYAVPAADAGEDPDEDGPPGSGEPDLIRYPE